mgnify:CR=1 FL=1
MSAPVSKRPHRQAHRQLFRHNLGTARLEFIHADVLDWKPGAENYVLVITNSIQGHTAPDVGG